MVTESFGSFQKNDNGVGPWCWEMTINFSAEHGWQVEEVQAGGTLSLVAFVARAPSAVVHLDCLVDNRHRNTLPE